MLHKVSIKQSAAYQKDRYQGYDLNGNLGIFIRSEI